MASSTSCLLPPPHPTPRPLWSGIFMPLCSCFCYYRYYCYLTFLNFAKGLLLMCEPAGLNTRPFIGVSRAVITEDNARLVPTFFISLSLSLSFPWGRCDADLSRERAHAQCVINGLSALIVSPANFLHRRFYQCARAFDGLKIV